VEEIAKRIEELGKEMDKCGHDMSCRQRIAAEAAALAKKALEISNEKRKKLEASPTVPSIPTEQLPQPWGARLLDPNFFLDCRAVNEINDTILLDLAEMSPDELTRKYNNQTGVMLFFCREALATLEQSVLAAGEGLWELSYDLEASHQLSVLIMMNVRFSDLKERQLQISVADPAKGRRKAGTVRMTRLDGWAITELGPEHAKKGPISSHEVVSDFMVVPPQMSLNSEFYEIAVIRPAVAFYHALGDPIPFGGCYDKRNLSISVSKTELREVLQSGGTISRTRVSGGDSHHCIKETMSFRMEFDPLFCKGDTTGKAGAVAVSGACADDGGYVVAKRRGVFVNGKAIATGSDKVFSIPEGTREIVPNDACKVFVKGMPIARVGDLTTTGARIAGGSQNTFAGN
jgi:uncharacterized Zn-binding protein involved in type VI secretion